MGFEGSCWIIVIKGRERAADIKMGVGMRQGWRFQGLG